MTKLQSVLTDVEQGFVVHADRFIRINDHLIEAQNCVVRLDDSLGNFR